MSQLSSADDGIISKLRKRENVSTFSDVSPTPQDRRFSPVHSAAATRAASVGGSASTAWLQVGIFGFLFIATYWPVLRWLWDKGNPIYGEPEWQHAMFVPVIGLYYLFVNRQALIDAPKRPAWSGLLILAGGLLMYGYAIWPLGNQWFTGIGLIVAIFGLVVLRCGWSVMKTAWFPIVFLVCAIPWPGLFYQDLAGPLQRLAATVAVYVLQMTGVDAIHSGTKIIMATSTGTWRTLNVEEACAGLRSLMAFVSVAAAIAFLSIRPLWQKAIIVISAVPIAIFCNVMRVSGQGLLDHYCSQQLSEGFAHMFVGFVMLMPAFFLILLVGWILDNIFIDEVDSKALEAREAHRLVVQRRKVGSAGIGPSGGNA
jgi:exosortase